MPKNWKRLILTALLAALLLAGCTGGGGSQPDLDNTSWMLFRLRGAPVLEGRQPTIHFAEGQASGFASCNSYGGEYQQRGERLSFGMIMSTEMACESTAVTQQEQAYLAALAETTGFLVQGERLMLLDENNVVLLEFTPQLFLAE